MSANITPCFYGGIVLVFPLNVSVSDLRNELHTNANFDIFSDCVEFLYCEIAELYSWDVNDLLTALFTKTDIEKAQAIINRFGGHFLVDISFHRCDERFPVLSFQGDNMRLINTLHANISIDPY